MGMKIVPCREPHDNEEAEINCIFDETSFSHHRCPNDNTVTVRARYAYTP